MRNSHATSSVFGMAPGTIPTVHGVALAMTWKELVLLSLSASLRLLPPLLHLAVARRPALAVVLRAALHGHRVVRHILGDDRARADIGAVADFDRRHQRRIGADEGAL